MKKHENKGEESLSSDLSNIANSSKYNSKISGIIDQAYSMNTLHLMSVFCQILLGSVVVLLSTAGLIQPIWVATSLSMLGSIATLLGLYFLYTVIFQKKNSERLLRDAMRRIMDAKN